MHIPQGKRFNTEVLIWEELRNNDTVGEIIKHLYLFREIPSESRQTLLSIGTPKNKFFTIEEGV